MGDPSTKNSTKESFGLSHRERRGETGFFWSLCDQKKSSCLLVVLQKRPESGSFNLGGSERARDDFSPSIFLAKKEEGSIRKLQNGIARRTKPLSRFL